MKTSNLVVKIKSMPSHSISKEKITIIHWWWDWRIVQCFQRDVWKSLTKLHMHSLSTKQSMPGDYPENRPTTI